MSDVITAFNWWCENVDQRAALAFSLVAFGFGLLPVLIYAVTVERIVYFLSGALALKWVMFAILSVE